MKKCLVFQCWNCPNTYTLLRELTDKQKLFVTCPYCGAEAVANLNYRSEKIAVFRSTEDNDVQKHIHLNLPKVLPTTKPETDET
jgi:hypothetical protein